MIAVALGVMELISTDLILIMLAGGALGGMAVALGVMELISTDLILIMLAGGALVGMVVALFGVPVAIQIVLALAAAVGLLAVIRPGMVHRLHAGPTLRTGAEALIGQRGYVL